NITKNNAYETLKKTDVVIVIAGVHVPGKYLSAYPGTVKEAVDILKRTGANFKKILTGPAATGFGSQVEGGKLSENTDLSFFDEVIPDYVHDYRKVAKASVAGAEIVKEIPWETIAEIETARGCRKSTACSFCTEPMKNRFELRESDDIIREVIALNKSGVKHFRLGKQSDFFSWNLKDMEKILKTIREKCCIETLHIDNCDPAYITGEKVKLIVRYCTDGNVAALGIESFDEVVAGENHLNSTPESAMRAIRMINEYGREYGPSGMPKFAPGLNLLFGLIGETKDTHRKNMEYLQKILDENLFLRRINIRQVAVYPGTTLYDSIKNKYIKKNKKYYWKWRNEIRQKIDFMMLKRIVPIGHIMKKVRMEIYDGNTTFGRQMGTYPLIVGVKKRLELGKYYEIRVTAHMLRSITGEIVEN
ncbi:MAG: radical SAM protein, partial [Nanoarchaeota archaeon]|nr:radical SAM protein [Nanoarchaeota archaeon]